MMRPKTRVPSPILCLAAGALLWSAASSVKAQSGESFTIVATEENTKDMSVNLVADTLRDDRIGPDGRYDPVIFGKRRIRPPSMAIPKQAAIKLVNHDSGILDIQHTFLASATLASRILISFESLQEELKNHCWSKEDAPNLKATLRLYVIPPYGPDKHNRLFGVTPTTHFRPWGIDPPPASVPIAVFTQQESWIEGDGQNSFFTATYDPQHLLDVSRVGVAGPGTVWKGESVEPVDLCLNRQPGRIAEGWEGRQARLCYDEDPNWQPWMEWDVTRAVQQWMQQDFDPARYHGFSLYQYPGEVVTDQVRFAPEEPGRARTRAVVSFASSSAKADCPSVGGLFGGPSQSEVVYANSHCMSADPNDMVSKVLEEGGDPVRFSRILDMKVRPEWAPQLVITATQPSKKLCSAKASLSPAAPDLSTQGPSALSFRFEPLRKDQSLRVQKVSLSATPGLLLERLSTGCEGAQLRDGVGCEESFSLRGEQAGKGAVEFSVEYLLDGPNATPQVLSERREVTISEDFDGTPDAVENMAPNQDANQDGIPDRQQSEVNTVADPRGGWLSVVAPRGLLVEQLEFPELTIDDSLGTVDFKRGFVSFRVKGLAPRQSSRVQIRSGRPFEPTMSFWAFGPTPTRPEPHWFALDNQGEYGSRIQDGVVELLLYDGALGDTDGQPNGEILVVGGVGLAVGATKKMPRITDATVASADWILLLLLGGTVLGGAGLSRRRES